MVLTSGKTLSRYVGGGEPEAEAEFEAEPEAESEAEFEPEAEAEFEAEPEAEPEPEPEFEPESESSLSPRRPNGVGDGGRVMGAAGAGFGLRRARFCGGAGVQWSCGTVVLARTS